MPYLGLLPKIVAHADWGTSPAKRWLACAVLHPDDLGYRDPGTPDSDVVRRIEGWILGQAAE